LELPEGGETRRTRKSKGKYLKKKVAIIVVASQDGEKGRLN